MRSLIVVSLAILAAGCGRKPAAGPAPPAEAAAPAAPRKASAVTMDPAMQKTAGIVVEAAALRSLPEVVQATARLGNDENRTWRVGAITEGRIVSVLANPGDTVTAGAVLARMHSHDIHESRAAYRKAGMELARARTEEGFTQRARDRARRLLELKAGSQEQFERAESELKNAQTMVANAQVDVDRTRHHLTEFLGVPADVPAAGDGETEYIPVTAPAAGTVISRSVTPGTVVTPANDLFTLSDLSTLWAIAEVNQEYLPRLRTGMPARIYVQAWGRDAFPGRIAKLGEAFEPATRTARVRIEVPNRGGRLKPEMYATAEIEVGGSATAVFVPQGAVQEVRGDNAVFVRTAADCFEVRPVEIGRSLDGSFEIRHGVKPGEQVATRGAFVLKSEFLKAAMAEE